MDGHPCRIRGAGAGGKPELPVTRILHERKSTKGHTPDPFAAVGEAAEVSGIAVELHEDGIHIV